MEVSFNKRKTKEWEFIIKGEETIFNPIKKELANDSTVSFVGFRKDHPLLEGVTFIIKGTNVEASFKKAVKAFEKDLKALTKDF